MTAPLLTTSGSHQDLRWSQINGTLYSLCFAGKAKKSAIRYHCLSVAFGRLPLQVQALGCGQDHPKSACTPGPDREGQECPSPLKATMQLLD